MNTSPAAKGPVEGRLGYKLRDLADRVRALENRRSSSGSGGSALSGRWRGFSVGAGDGPTYMRRYDPLEVVLINNLGYQDFTADFVMMAGQELAVVGGGFAPGFYVPDPAAHIAFATLWVTKVAVLPGGATTTPTPPGVLRPDVVLTLGAMFVPGNAVFDFSTVLRNNDGYTIPGSANSVGVPTDGIYRINVGVQWDA